MILERKLEFSSSIVLAFQNVLGHVKKERRRGFFFFFFQDLKAVDTVGNCQRLAFTVGV